MVALSFLEKMRVILPCDMKVNYKIRPCGLRTELIYVQFNFLFVLEKTYLPKPHPTPDIQAFAAFDLRFKMKWNIMCSANSYKTSTLSYLLATIDKESTR